MITKEDVAIYVAARKAEAPKLPLREALVTIAIECIYEPRDASRKQKSKKKSSGRKRISVKRFLKWRKASMEKQLKCMLYSHDNLQEKSLSSYLEQQKNSLRDDHGGRGGSDDCKHHSADASRGGSTLSSLTMTKILQEKEFHKVEERHSDVHRQQSFRKAMMFDFISSDKQEPTSNDDFETDVMSSFEMEDAPSLAASDVDMDDMTMNTYALIGVRDVKDPPEVLITNANENCGKWWSEESARVSPLVFEDPQDKEKKEVVANRNSDVSQTKSGNTVQDYILDQDVETPSRTDCLEDLSTMIDSTCSVLCPVYGVFTTPENHDLSLMVELDEDLKSLDRRFKLDIENEKRSHEDECEATCTLFDMVGDSASKPEDIMRFLVETPGAVQELRKMDGRLPLHVLCDTSLDDSLLLTHAVGFQIDDIITSCIKEISRHRMLIKLITWSYIGACGQPDARGDLPSHLLGRRLLLWMESLQTFMRQTQLNVTNYERMTTLSGIISECIDVVLRPISMNKDACMVKGFRQTALPLHLSIIFGGDIDIFRLILETYSDGASVPFTLDGRSILPLELLEVIQNDQHHLYSMMCDARNLEGMPLLWNATIPISSYQQEIQIKSDLLFCFNPFSSLLDNAHRSNRILKLIRTEAKQNRGLWKESVSPSIQSIWIWICKQEDEAYVGYVERIVKNLKMFSLQKLIKVQTSTGDSILHVATPMIQNVLLKAQMYYEQIPQVDEEGSEDLHLAKKHPKEASDDSAQIASAVSKSIFGIKVDDIPVSFIVFPFPLDHSEDNGGVLVAERHAQLAVKFANWMMNAASPEMVRISLQRKMESKGDTYASLENRRNVLLDKEMALVSSLYRKGGYLYFIDEGKGTPIVEASEGWNYPIFMPSAVQQIETLLPLMRLGMILMRKSQSISILSQVIADQMENGCDRDLSETWISAAKNLIRYYDDELLGARDSLLVRERRVMKSRLLHFLSLSASNIVLDVSGNDRLDWSTEVSLLLMIIENRGFVPSSLVTALGMKRKKLSHINGAIVWIKAFDQDNKTVYHDSQDELEDILNQNDDDDDDDIQSLFQDPKPSISQEYAKSFDSGRHQNLLPIDKTSKNNNDAALDRKISEMNNFLAMNDEEDELFNAKYNFSDDDGSSSYSGEKSSSDSSFCTCKQSDNEDESDYDDGSSTASSGLFGSAYF